MQTITTSSRAALPRPAAGNLARTPLDLHGRDAACLPTAVSSAEATGDRDLRFPRGHSDARCDGRGLGKSRPTALSLLRPRGDDAASTMFAAESVLRPWSLHSELAQRLCGRSDRPDAMSSPVMRSAASRCPCSQWSSGESKRVCMRASCVRGWATNTAGTTPTSSHKGRCIEALGPCGAEDGHRTS